MGGLKIIRVNLHFQWNEIKVVKKKDNNNQVKYTKSVSPIIRLFKFTNNVWIYNLVHFNRIFFSTTVSYGYTAVM